MAKQSFLKGAFILVFASIIVKTLGFYTRSSLSG